MENHKKFNLNHTDEEGQRQIFQNLKKNLNKINPLAHIEDALGDFNLTKCPHEDDDDFVTVSDLINTPYTIYYLFYYSWKFEIWTLLEIIFQDGIYQT